MPVDQSIYLLAAQQRVGADQLYRSGKGGFLGEVKCLLAEAQRKASWRLNPDRSTSHIGLVFTRSSRDRLHIILIR